MPFQADETAGYIFHREESCSTNSSFLHMRRPRSRKASHLGYYNKEVRQVSVSEGSHEEVILRRKEVRSGEPYNYDRKVGRQDGDIGPESPTTTTRPSRVSSFLLQSANNASTGLWRLALKSEKEEQSRSAGMIYSESCTTT